MQRVAFRLKISKECNRLAYRQYCRINPSTTRGAPSSMIASLICPRTRESGGNYRPVSLTAKACKILKSILRDNIIKHLRELNLIKSSQHGFVKNGSCLTNLLEFLEYVSDYIDKGLPVDVIYLDFSKTVYKVPHKRLMVTVKAHDIRDKIWS